VGSILLLNEKRRVCLCNAQTASLEGGHFHNSKTHALLRKKERTGKSKQSRKNACRGQA
jgi:hypothetical protein